MNRLKTLFLGGCLLLAAAGAASACGMSGLEGDCAAACRRAPKGWEHTLCVLSATHDGGHDQGDADPSPVTKGDHK
ncbi:hypothetical protein ACFFJB_09090 [Camelimonas abortus]|uniref:hypothetical protein n=1 Tax=Camelimonas abortus TaxID=1017184 RepID=UPI0035EDAB64